MDRQATGRDEGGAAKGQPVSASLTLQAHLPASPGAGLSGFAQGARVATMDGLLPVEYLGLGDRVITRSGARVLRGISAIPFVTQLVRIAPGALGHDRPGEALVLGAATEVLLRDWRAEVMFGRKQALVAVSRLVDGQFVTRLSGVKTRLFALHFDAPEVIYADGVEIGCVPMPVVAGRC